MRTPEEKTWWLIAVCFFIALIATVSVTSRRYHEDSVRRFETR